MADWSAFILTLESTLNSLPATHHLDRLKMHVIEAFQMAGRTSIPLTKLPSRHYRDHWIYGHRVKELNHRLNTARKLFLRCPYLP